MSEFKSLAEEVSQFYDSPYKFVVWAFDWGYGTLKGFDGPDEWAQSYLLQIGSQVKKRRFNGVDAVEPQRYAVASGHGIGKLHNYNVIVPTPFGMRRWGDLNIGDVVFGGDGYPTQIIGTKHYKDVPMYRVSFDDGSCCDVSSGHLWNVRGRQEDSWRTLETIDILEIGVKRHNGCAMANQWEIPIQGAAQFEEREVYLQPYLVGVLLGDWSKGQPIYTKPFSEADRISSFAYLLLFKEGVFTLESHERYIPDDYKYNTIKNRMELFKGLCDSDGEIHASGSIGYSTTSKRLADDIIWLSRSLGCKAQLQDCRDCYRVTINSPFNPFTLKHRKERYKPSEHRYLTRLIDSIEPIDNSDGMCITVSNADGLYLANDFIPTHNSCLTAWLILWIMSTRPNCKGIVTANTSAQLESKTWAELAKWRKLCKTGDWFELNSGKGSLKMYHKEYPETWRVDAQTCREENSESFAGLHAAGSTPFYLFDESSAIPDKIWEVAEGGMTDGEPMWFVFGNPTRNTGRFRECFGKNKHRWFTRQIDSRDVKITNKTQIKQWVDDYGEDSDFVRVRVKGEFPRAGSMQFISSEDVEAARRREPITSIHDPCVLGIDVARFGDDETVLCIRRGRDARSVEWVTMRGADTMTVAARVVDMINLYSPDMCFVDEGGVGGGVVDRLNQLRYSVIGVQFGGKSDRAVLSGQGAVGYKNKRAEMWGNMKEWLKGGSIPDDPDLASQLTGVEYGYVLQGGQDVIVLEKKEDMKKRGLSSPDKADALCFVGDTLIITPSGNKRIDELAVGDEIITPLGVTRIAVKWNTQTEKLTTALFSNGVSLCGKGEHKVFVWGCGEKRLDALTLNDVVSLHNQRRFTWAVLKLLNIVGCNIQFRPLVNTILHGRGNVTGFTFCTVAFGKIITEIFQEITTSITKMVTGVIIEFPTLRLFIDQFIGAITHNTFVIQDTFVIQASANCGKQNGKALHGINNAQYDNGKMPKQKQNNAKYVVRTTKLIWQTLGFALNHVVKELRFAGSLQMLKGVVPFVVNYFSRLLNIQAMNVVPVSVVYQRVMPTDVYNLTLEKHNAYYANGILVYNCLTFAYPINKSDHSHTFGKNKVGFTSSYDPLDDKYILNN